jgi:hypothetical protein
MIQRTESWSQCRIHIPFPTRQEPEEFTGRDREAHVLELLHRWGLELGAVEFWEVDVILYQGREFRSQPWARTWWYVLDHWRDPPTPAAAPTWPTRLWQWLLCVRDHLP